MALCLSRLGSQARHFAFSTIRVRPAMRTVSKLPFLACCQSVLREHPFNFAAAVMGIKPFSI